MGTKGCGVLSPRVPLIAVLIVFAGVFAGAQTPSTDLDPAGATRIFIDSVTSLGYSKSDKPYPLGNIDRLGFAQPINDLTLSLRSASGIEVSIMTRLVAEYTLEGAFNVPEPQSGNPVAVENNIVYKGILSLPFFGGNVTLGRQAISLGPARWSNLQISPQVPYLDSVYFRLPLGRLEITQVIVTLENRQGVDDVTIPTVPGYNFKITDIILSSRRFVWAADTFDVAVGAQSLFSRPYNAYQLGDLLPIFSVHNGDVGVNNITFLADLNVRAIPDHRQYLILGLDDVNANLFGIDDYGIPTIWAIVGGVAGLFRGPSFDLEYTLETTATHYLWGSFENFNPLSRSIDRLYTDGGNILLPLSSPYGPARISLRWETTAKIPNLFDAGLSGLLLWGDPTKDLTKTSYEAQGVNYQYMLTRFEVSLSKSFGSAWKLKIGGGGDFLPDAFYPRFSLSGTWIAHNEYPVTPLSK